MLTDAKDEEKKLQGNPKLRDQLRVDLGLDVIDSSQVKSSISQEKPAVKRARSVGKPLPRRRPVGKDQYVGQ